MAAIDPISTGDRVFSIEDRPIGIVTGIVGTFLRVAGNDGAEALLNSGDVYTVEHHRVTMMFSSTRFAQNQVRRN